MQVNFVRNGYAQVYRHQTTQVSSTGGETPITAVDWVEKSEVVTKTPGRQPAIFVDRDGVINQFLQPGDKISDHLYPNAVESLVRLMESTKLPVYIVSNQGHQCHGDPQLGVDSMIELADAVVAAGGRLSGILYTTQPWGARPSADTVSAAKPKPGLFLQAAQQDLGQFDLADSYMIGDSVTDTIAAKKAHRDMTTIMVKTGRAGVDPKRHRDPDHWASDIEQAVDWIIARETSATSV